MHRHLAIIAVLLFAGGNALVGDIIDFETLPSAYMFSGGSQNIGSYYSGVNFGPNVTGLDLTGSAAYPPHSGSIAVWDPTDLSITIDFSGPQTLVGIWYTSFDILTMQAFGSTGALLGSVIGAANTDGTTGASDFLSLAGGDIRSVVLAGSPGNFVFDDVTFLPSATSSVPEPGSALLLSGGLFFVACYQRRHRAARQRDVTGPGCASIQPPAGGRS